MSTTVVNGVPPKEGNMANASGTNVGRQPNKSAFTNKNPDGLRKQAANPNEAAKRNAPQKAWTSGMNPITQRSNTPTQQNGVGLQAKATSQKPPNNQESITPEKHANDRLMYLLGNCMGLSASLTLKNGDIFTGIFFGATLETYESAYLLKMVQQANVKGDAGRGHDHSEEYIGVGQDHAMSFDTKDVAALAVEGVNFNAREKSQNGANAGFRTDTDISGNLAVRERPLQKWEPSTDNDVCISLDFTGESWDQFQANEEKFGLKSDYNENIYTTTIDKSNPLYRQREEEAERIAHEIEGASGDNSMAKEAEAFVIEGDGRDEEERYSSVRRQASEYPPLKPSQGNNKYMPPARRFPTARPTVPGAPVDPAIISSQIARPEGNIQNHEEKPSSEPKAELNKTNDVVKESSGSKATINEIKNDPSTEVNDVGISKSRFPGASKMAGSNISATINVETEVLDSFRQFASFEKMRVSDSRRQRVSQDKAIKLNDLMKFSKNFKLLTPVPKDLVPILAKDKAKQDEIMENAQRNAQSANTPPKVTTSSDQKSARPLAEAKYEGARGQSQLPEHQGFSPVRPTYLPQGPQAALAPRPRQQESHNVQSPSSKTGQGMLGHRLAENRRNHQGGLAVNIPHPLPIQHGPKNGNRSSAAPPITGSQPSSNARTPTSAVSARFNAKANEFRPNPAANTFRPTGPSATSSARSTPNAMNARSLSRATSPSAFFGNKKPLPVGERALILDHFNPLKRLKEKAKAEEKTKDYAANKGIPPAYATPPTWKSFQEGDKSYKEMFEDVAPAPNRTSPQQASPVNPPLPHHHQLPLHLQHGSQNVPHLQPPQPTSYIGQSQNHHYPNGQHYHDDHRMHLSASNSSVYPSPRMQNANLGYPSPIPQPAQLAYGQTLPQYIMGPNGPQPAHFRQFPTGPQAHIVSGPAPPLAAPMMVQQSSQGGFIAPSHGISIPFNPNIPVYPPVQPAAYVGQSQAPSGYPSPGRGAPMMMHQGSHQGSHQGHQPPIYANSVQYGPPVYAQQPPPHMLPVRNYGSPQPHFNQNPHQQFHYPPQATRSHSNSYNQGHHQHMGSQHAPPPSAPLESGEEAK